MSSTFERSVSLAPSESRAALFWRSGRASAVDVRIDLAWLLGLGILLVAVGIGLREPWPADEPRFVLIARDMLAGDQWLFPRIGGDLYADKPPLYFWLLAICIRITGSIKVGFLLPSLIATFGSVVSIYDLARRLWNRETGLAAGLMLLLTFQFVWQGRQAQIDALSCFWITFSLCALLRHLLLGPAWRWYAVGWFAAGLGVITKGVGFLPLLLLPIYFLVRGHTDGTDSSRLKSSYWWLGPAAFIVAISCWLVPMIVESASDPGLLEYRNDILFHQTIDRYASAWMHRKPPWYYITEVIPSLWLPLIALVPWLWTSWRRAFAARDLRVVLPLIWVVAVVVFFSISSGKRGVYILPGVPALTLAAAPYLPQLFNRRGVQRLFAVLGWAFPCVAALALIYLQFATGKAEQITALYDIHPEGPLLAMTIAGVTVGIVTRHYSLWTYTGNLALLMILVGGWIYPSMDASRSGARLMKEVEVLASDVEELGLVAYKEQYLLQSSRPTYNFGHARWRQPGFEVHDAAAWLDGHQNRALLINGADRNRCFSSAISTPVGRANDEDWFLVRAAPDADCVREGDPQAARLYNPRSIR